MPAKLLACMTLPPATITSAPIFDYADANEELADMYGYGNILFMLWEEYLWRLHLLLP